MAAHEVVNTYSLVDSGAVSGREQLPDPLID
jgi:hypothetical protein